MPTIKKKWDLTFFHKRFRETPNREVYKTYCKNPPPDMTLREAFEKVLLDPNFPPNTKRRHHIGFSKNRLEESGLMGEKIGNLTYKMLAPFVKTIQKKYPPASVEGIWYPFIRAIRFVTDGDMRSHRIKDVQLPKLSSGEISIQHQFISIEKALELTTKNMGRFAPVKTEIHSQLIQLPHGKSYILQLDMKADKKEMDCMKTSIANYLHKTLKKKYLMKTSFQKRVFAFFHYADLKPQGANTNGTK